MCKLKKIEIPDHFLWTVLQVASWRFGGRAAAAGARVGGRVQPSAQFGSRLQSTSALLDASYEAPQKQVGEYKLDERFSTADTRVYHHKDQAPTIVHRGTVRASDWKDNALVAIGLGHLGSRHKKARLITQQVEKAYGRTANAIGHSLGGRLAETSGAGGQITTYNKAAGLGDLFKKQRPVDWTCARVVTSCRRSRSRSAESAQLSPRTLEG
jgi:hypothetical protein